MNPKLGCAGLHLCYTMEQAQYTQFCSVFEGAAVTECKSPQGHFEKQNACKCECFFIV